MKFLIAFTLCLCVAFTLADWADIKARLRAGREKCNADSTTRISDEIYERIKDGEIPNDENVGSFCLCMAKKMGWCDNEGKLQKDLLRERITNSVTDPDRRKIVMERCLLEKDTPTETAKNVMRCLMKARKDKDIL